MENMSLLYGCRMEGCMHILITKSGGA